MASGRSVESGAASGRAFLDCSLVVLSLFERRVFSSAGRILTDAVTVSRPSTWTTYCPGNCSQSQICPPKSAREN